jgi:hypothetical protein
MTRGKKTLREQLLGGSDAFFVELSGSQKQEELSMGLDGC